MPPARKGRKSAAAAKAAAEPAVVETEAKIKEVTEEVLENDDFNEDLEGALAQEEEALSNEETNEIEEAISAEMETTENIVESNNAVEDDTTSTGDIIIEKEIEREEEMEEVVDSEGEEETLVNELIRETGDDDIIEIEPETAPESKGEEKGKTSNEKMEKTEEKEKSEEKTTKAETEENKDKGSEKKFVPKKIVLNFDDDSLELKVNQDDLFEADDTPVKKLIQCSICENICARGVSTKCCFAIACRMCATKKLTADKQCWMCNAPLKTEDLINNEDLRTAVSLFKTDKEIPEDLINKLKKESKKGKSDEKERTVSPTDAAEKPKTKDGSGKSSETTKPKKDTILYLEQNHDLSSMENGFEDETTKVYMAIQGTRFRINQKNESILFQVSMLNGETGKSWVFAMVPDKRLRGDADIMDLLHVTKATINNYVIDIVDAKIDCFRSENSFHNNIIKFLKEAQSGSKGIDLVMYSNAEHHELYRCIGKRIEPYVTNTYVYEDIVLNENINPISSTEWRANKWVLKLRELFSKTSKDKFKKKNFRDIKSLPLVKISGVLIVSPCHTDVNKWMHFGENKQDANKRKSVDSSVKPDSAVKKAKLEPKSASANTAQETKKEDLRSKLATKKVGDGKLKKNDVQDARKQSQINKNFNNGRDNRGQGARGFDRSSHGRQDNRGQDVRGFDRFNHGRQDNRGQFGRQNNRGTAGGPINPWAKNQDQGIMNQAYNGRHQANLNSGFSHNGPALLGDRPSPATREAFQRNSATDRSNIQPLMRGMEQRNDSRNMATDRSNVQPLMGGMEQRNDSRNLATGRSNVQPLMRGMEQRNDSRNMATGRSNVQPLMGGMEQRNDSRNLATGRSNVQPLMRGMEQRNDSRNLATDRSNVQPLMRGMEQRNDSGLSSNLVEKQLAIQMEAQRIEKLKLELELEKIKIERAKLSQMKNSLHSTESPFNTQKDNSYQSDRSGNYDQYDKSRNYDNNDRSQYGGQAESYGMQDGFQNGGRQANMSADRFGNDRQGSAMFSRGDQITRDDVKRVMDGGSLNQAVSPFVGGGVNNSGSTGMGGAMNSGGGDMQFASDRYQQPTTQQSKFNPMMGSSSANGRNEQGGQNRVKANSFWA